MDRRDFFKTLLATPILTPLLLASKKTFNDSELFLICEDSPRFISFLLKELKGKNILSGKYFTFLSPHPQAEELAEILSRVGWADVPDLSQADLSLSFSRLQQAARPSFTFVQKGQIWDLRSQKLQAFWQGINHNQAPSSCLTTAGFRHKSSPGTVGKYACIFKSGQLTDKLPLNKNTMKTYKTSKGALSARIENGKAWISESPCQYQICCHTPPASQAGERIICAPQHFLLEIRGDRSVDTIIG